MSFSQNIFDALEENIEEIVHQQPAIPTVSFSLKDPLQDGNQNEDIFSVLNTILETQNQGLKNQQTVLKNQNELKSRVEKLEQNMPEVLKNQSVLSHGLSAIVSNQELIADKIDKVDANIVIKAEIMAQSKLLLESKVSIKKVDKKLDEVASMLPLSTIVAVEEVEQKLDTPYFAQAMTTFIHKLKGTSEDVSSVIRALFTDDLLEKYNWEGRWEKRPFLIFNFLIRHCEMFFNNKVLLNLKKA